MTLKKIFLLKRLSKEILVTSVAVGETSFCWRTFAHPQEVATMIRQEDCGLLFFDQRGVSGDPFAFIESVRDQQKKTPIFLMSRTLEMVSVIQAIRLGVKDYFQPPFDFRIIVDRAQAALKSIALNPEGIHLDKWTEFVKFLTDGSGEIAASAKPEARNVVTELGSSGAGKPLKTMVHVDHSSLGKMREELEIERETLEEERLLFKQAQKKFESARKSAESSGNGPEIDFFQREQALAAERKNVEEKNRHVIAAQERLEEELMILVQSKAKLDKEQALKMEQLKAVLADCDTQQKKLVTEREAFDQNKIEWEKAQAAWPVEKAKIEEDFARREKILARLDADLKKLADGEEKLMAELEKIDTEQGLLAQAKAKQEKVRVDNETRFTQRENGLVDRALALDAQKKAQSLAEDEFLVEQEKLDSAQVLFAQGRQALEQAKAQLEKTQVAWQAQKTKTEAEFARREQELAPLEAEAKKLSDGQKKLAAELEKLETEQSVLMHAQAKLEKIRLENEAKHAQREKELAQQTETLAAKHKSLAEQEKQLPIEQEKLNSALLLANQTQARLIQEAKALEQAKVQLEKNSVAAQAERSESEAILQKRIKDFADREEQIVQKEKNIAPLKEQLALEQEKLETDQLVAKQTLAKIAAERAELATERTTQQKMQRELAEQETALQETEVKTHSQLAQLKKAQAQLVSEQTALIADKKALSEETASLAERLRQYESRQQQVKEQMKQMLSSG